jgi:hypothetical protein
MATQITPAAPMKLHHQRGRYPRSTKPSTRSPEGSLEFIEMMKKAKEAKDTAPK